MILVPTPTAPVVPDAGADPTAPPRVVGAAPTPPLGWTWTSWTGESWDLTDLASPVLKLRGATGTGQAETVHWWSEAPMVDGDTYGGSRTGRGSVFLPVMVHADAPAGFFAAHDAFMRSLDPRRTGMLRVTRPDGSWRQIECRYESGADMAMTLDPVATRRASYGITWATGDPFWAGGLREQRFVNDAVSDFFPGPPFSLAPGLNLSNPSLSNPGDVEAHPVWRVEGPFTGFSLGVGGSLVAMTLTKGAGQWVEIDMRPGRLTMLDDGGVDRWDNVTDVAFADIPPGTTTLTTTVVGASSATAITVSFTPRYRRAW